MGSIEKTIAEIRESGGDVYFDTNAFIYFLDGGTQFSKKIHPFFEAVDSGQISGSTGDLVIAELLVKPIRDGNVIAERMIRSLFDAMGKFRVLPHDRGTLELAAYIRARQNLAMPDAIHVATAISARCSHMITNDSKIAHRIEGMKSILISELE
ncbi:type II toxin-antitoxin system VapC family toxin [Allofranklinella schreckenbergeri]|uniref:Type II toxin-antitoxin system VapC family toxin n=1 Tax=Allofranklinella schreckenbergeri TaxID=1076744 RepID=A0A3M6R9V9_9BURK|nr:type II toxin-antitoxin system VapC family toxin [Allofranklinella schreckenbergeri]RMX11788.1 type II toxin-antitoxin system VapC family toxin [Allofranklinella schreckenbergeri]